MDSERKGVDSRALVWGFILIGFGVFGLLDRMHIAHFGDLVREWWPMIFVAIGLAKLVRGNVWGAFWFLVIGAWCEAAQLGLWGITFESSWPLVLVAVGGGMIVRAIVDAQRRHEAVPPEERHG